MHAIYSLFRRRSYPRSTIADPRRRAMQHIRHLLAIAAVAAAVLAVATLAHGSATATRSARPSVLCSNHAAAPKLAGKRVTLTGVYRWRLGTFYIRQVGTCLYLMGQSNADANGPAGKGFTSIYIGGITPGLTVKGIWSDIPYGEVTGSGTVVLRITEPHGIPNLTVLSSTGGWGADQLVRTRA
jgi:hypothetical protein